MTRGRVCLRFRRFSRFTVLLRPRSNRSPSRGDVIRAKTRSPAMCLRLRRSRDPATVRFFLHLSAPQPPTVASRRRYLVKLPSTTLSRETATIADPPPPFVAKNNRPSVRLLFSLSPSDVPPGDGEMVREAARHSTGDSREKLVANSPDSRGICSSKRNVALTYWRPRVCSKLLAVWLRFYGPRARSLVVVFVFVDAENPPMGRPSSSPFPSNGGRHAGNLVAPFAHHRRFYSPAGRSVCDSTEFVGIFLPGSDVYRRYVDHAR